MTVVSCKDAAWDESLLNWVVDPLVYTKRNKPKKAKNASRCKLQSDRMASAPIMPAPPRIVKACHQCSIFNPESGLLMW